MSHVTLGELRELILVEPDDGDWLTPSNIRVALSREGYAIGWNGWERIALLLERMAHEGLLEIQNPRSRGKRFFRRIG
jgi:hypothetical protein